MRFTRRERNQVRICGRQMKIRPRWRHKKKRVTQMCTGVRKEQVTDAVRARALKKDRERRGVRIALNVNVPRWKRIEQRSPRGTDSSGNDFAYLCTKYSTSEKSESSSAALVQPQLQTKTAVFRG